VYADKEETHTVGNAKITFYVNIYAEKEQLPYGCTIDAIFKM